MTESTDKSRVNFMKLKIVISHWGSASCGPRGRGASS